MIFHVSRCACRMNPSKKTIQLGCMLLLIEGAYMAASRWAFWSLGHGITSEFWRTGIRTAAALCLYLFFKKTLFSRTPEQDFWRSPIAVASLVFMVLAGLAPMSLQEPTSVQWVFIATSLMVGVHEEFLFRGLLLNWFEKRMGTGLAIVVTVSLFCLFHLGLRGLYFPVYLEIFMAGVVLSAAYLLSGSLWLVVLLHAGYDMLRVMHFQRNPLDWPTLLAFLLAATIAGIAALVLQNRRLLSP